MGATLVTHVVPLVFLQAAEERLDGAHVLPVAVKAVADDPGPALQHGGADVGAEVPAVLRQPAQETINIAAVEDVRSIQATVDYFRKKREIKRLQDRFHDVLSQFINR